jgi:type IV secretory pathway VirB10-like protein
VNEQTPLEAIKSESSQKGKDSPTRKLLIILVVLWLITLVGFCWVTWDAYFHEKQQKETLAQQIAFACVQGDLGEGISPEDEKALCENAQEVIEENDPELQDEEVQESEIQESEFQDLEIQEPEVQEPEIADPENQEAENQDAESQDPEEQEGEVQDGEEQEGEIQDPENQDPEEQEPENQDPEIDDPDPASPFMFTFNFTVPASHPGDQPDIYTVTCNSGTGECTVS